MIGEDAPDLSHQTVGCVRRGTRSAGSGTAGSAATPLTPLTEVLDLAESLGESGLA